MHSVYALCDPRTGDIRYIGQAVDIHKRYGQHLLYPHENEAKNAWMQELKQAGNIPTLIVLEKNIPAQNIYQREMFWITYYLERGFNLTNIIVPGYSPHSHKRKITPKQEIMTPIDPMPLSQQPNFIGMQETCRFLSLPEDEVLKIAKKLGGFRLSKRWYFHKAAIARYLEQ